MKKLLFLAVILILINSVSQAQGMERPTENLEFGKNNVSIFLSDIVLKRLSFEYEHVFGDQGNMSINVPFSIALAEVTDIYDDQVKWWVGIGMKLYPTGQGKIRYFLGPEIRVISASYSGYYYDHYDYYTEQHDVSENYIHTAFLLNNGFIYEPVENFIFTINLGLGLMARDEKTNDGIRGIATPSVRMGFRF